MIPTFALRAQDTLAGWTFPTGTSADANPDFGLPANAAMSITAQGGTSAVDFSKNGLTTYSAQTTSWDGGANIKYWQIEVSTIGYKNLKLNSVQTSGGNKPGPRDFKTQYKIGYSGTWSDIPNTTLVTANDWTSAVLSDLSIPTACENKDSVFIRWIMTSDTSSAPPALVMANGVSKIDNIFITGNVAGAGIVELPGEKRINIYPNPCKGEFLINFDNAGEPFRYEIISSDGRVKFSATTAESSIKIAVADLPPSFYIIRVICENAVAVKQILVLK